jgi:hypothetical protein
MGYTSINYELINSNESLELNKYCIHIHILHNIWVSLKCNKAVHVEKSLFGLADMCVSIRYVSLTKLIIALSVLSQFAQLVSLGPNTELGNNYILFLYSYVNISDFT